MVVLRNTACKYFDVINAYWLLANVVYFGISYYYIELAINAKSTKEAPSGYDHLFCAVLFSFWRRIELFQPLVYHLFVPKAAKNHLKPLKSKLVKYREIQPFSPFIKNHWKCFYFFNSTRLHQSKMRNRKGCENP